MKKIYLLLIAVFLVVRHSHAQNTFTNTGANVGIGTTTPDQKLTIKGGGIGFDWNSTDKKLYSPNDGDLEWMTHSSAGVHGFAVSHQGSKKVYLNTNGDSYINGGNLGIGSTDPKTKLDISGDVVLRNYQNNGGAGASLIFTPYADDYTHGARIKSFLDFAAGDQSKVRLVLSSYWEGYKDELTLMNGNVGIGTLWPDSKLSVKGTIHSQEVKVDMNGWADYVFKPSYKLPSLTEVKSYIDQNQHLPEMPSEQEVAANGINLGEIVKLQTKKIEELTLYLIEQQKQIQELKLPKKL